MKVVETFRRVEGRLISFVLLILGLVVNAAWAAPEIEVLRVEKPRVIVLTDITNEPDDQQSLVRFLVYANEFDVEAIVATTSTWLRDRVRPDRIIELVEAYGQVRDNLLRHARGYPTMEHLLTVTKAHLPLYGMAGVGEGKSSEGSRLIVDVVDRDDDRPVWVTVWGGVNCLAQALWDVRNTRSPEEVDRFVSKLRVYTISDQDDSGRWLRLEFPDLFYIVSPSDERGGEYHKATWTGIAGDLYYRNGPMHRFELVDNPWLEKNIIHGHGPLGALYPLTAYIMEGDTPSFLGLIDNGLGSALSPSYGGWGGRYQLYQTYAEIRPIWTNARESRDEVTAENGCTYTTDQATIWRWREAYQHDFAARMDWSVAERYEDANHNPLVVVNGHEGKDVLRMRVSAGDEVALSAAGTTDPDGDELFFRWFVYREAGNYAAEVELNGAATPDVRVTAPDVDRSREIHVILEVRDDGEPSLYAYRRVIIEVEPR
jgi:hypothetical protein